ncbi:MAG: TonB-dependent receptor [Candidatus Cloacimonetes bacterium]|nr:TonB-dependent receptor [Candidatus Cloacimonadota bacterium]
MRILLCAIIVVLLILPVQKLFSESNYTIEELLEMPLEELLKLKVRSGTLMDIEKWEIPVALTVIEKRDIEMTPARNILDLLEIYVPGFTYVEHYKGARMGLRGMLSDQNYSFLLLVNGKNTNLKYIHGPFFEIINKDLSDIQRIEVIRGPGSVTYGPGAIAGIINIVTINGHEEKVNMAAFSENLLYNFNKFCCDTQYETENFSSSLYFSKVKSAGNDDTKFWYIDRAHGYGYGFMNPSWGNMDKGTLPPIMYRDYQENPEIKLQYCASFWQDYEVSARYTTMSQPYITQSSQLFGQDIWSGIIGRHAAIELNHNHIFSDKLNYQSTFGYDSADICEYCYYAGEDYPLEHASQKGLSFSENEYNYNFQLNYSPVKQIDLAIGAEYIYEYYAPQWGKEDDSFLMSFQSPIHFAVMDTSSGFYQVFHEDGYATLIDEDISCQTYSIFTETNLSLHKYFKLMLSERFDNHSLAEPAYSSRIALISPLNKDNILKLSLQKSVRLPGFMELFSQYYLDSGTSEFEELKGIELAYQRLQNKNLSLGFNAYYNEIDQFAWLPTTNVSGLAGTLDLMGLEMEVQYKTGKSQFGVNYSFIEQLSWNSTFNDTALISGLDGEIIYIKDNASNRINNLPKHSLKFFWNKTFTENFRFHLDGRFAFDYQQSEMLDKFEAAHQEYGNPVTITELEEIISALEDHGYAQPSFTSDLSISWKKELNNLKFTTTVFARNLLSYNHIRYIIQYWENDDLRQYPRQCGFIEEPLDIGLKISCSF